MVDLSHDGTATTEPNTVKSKGIDSTAVLAALRETVYSWSIPSDKLEWAQGADICMGLDRAAMATGKAFAAMLAPGFSAGRVEAVLNSAMRDHGDGVAYRIDYGMKRADGSIFYVEDYGRWFGSSDGRPLRAEGIVRVVDKLGSSHAGNDLEAGHDALTGQLTRSRLNETLETAIAEAVHSQQSVGLLLVAIDNLTHINEAYGFDIADEIILTVARRLRSRVRGGDVLGRHSGNKFGIIMRNCGPEDMAIAAERIIASIREAAISTSAGAMVVSVSAGGVLAPRHGKTLTEVVARAQEALDGVKSRKRGAFELFVPNLERDNARKANIAATDEIITALNDGRISLAFQPIVSAQQGHELVDHECLLRIHRRDGTLIPAASIVPVAEKLGLIRLMDARVLDLAVAELLAYPAICLSVNVSPASTMDPDWMRRFEAQMRAHPEIAGRITIEITETAAIADLDEIRRFVARVKDLGAEVWIDDFGAGYTSFRNLREIGANAVKIDGAFVNNFERSDDDRHFVKTLLGLAQHMGLKTVAEWVQTEGVADALRDLGCNYLQGNLYGAATEAPFWRGSVMAAKAAG